MRLLTSSLIAAALVILLMAGHAGIAQAPTGKAGDSPSEQLRQTCSAHRGNERCGTVPVLPGDVPEVVATAERPAGMMPEVVVGAGRMPEVVVRSSWVQAPVASSAPSTFTIN